MTKRPLRIALSLATGILITIGGCSESPTTAAPDAGEQFQQVRLATPNGGSASFNRSGLVMGEAAQVIGPEGGTLSIPGGHQLVFPAGALAEPTKITARPGAVFIEVEFGPHGLQFPEGSEPVLTMSYGAAVNVRNESSLVIAYMKGVRAREILDSRIDPQAKTVSGKLRHFSIYAVGGSL